MIPGTGQGGGLWVNQVAAFSPKYRCIPIDNRGAGKSEVTTDGYTIRQMAADAIALLEHLDLQKVHLCGQSMGALIAQEIAAARPDLVHSLQLHSTFDRVSNYPHLRRQLEIRLQLVRGELWDIFGPNSVIWLNPPDYVNAHDAELTQQQERFFKNLPESNCAGGAFRSGSGLRRRRPSELDRGTDVDHRWEPGHHDIAVIRARGAGADSRFGVPSLRGRRSLAVPANATRVRPGEPRLSGPASLSGVIRNVSGR